MLLVTGHAANVRPYPEGGVPIMTAERYEVVCDFRPLAGRCGLAWCEVDNADTGVNSHTSTPALSVLA
jgi:hypothetical protein